MVLIRWLGAIMAVFKKKKKNKGKRKKITFLAILFLLLKTLVSLVFVSAALLYVDIARYNRRRCCCFADECRLVFLSRM